MRDKLERAAFWVGVISVFVVGFCLRFYRLGERSIWSDEAVGGVASMGSLEDLYVITCAYNSMPLGYPLLLWLSRGVSDSVEWLRGISLVFSLGAMAVLFLCAGQRISRWSCLFAAGFLSVGYLQVRQGQEMREYSIAMFLAALMLVGLIWLCDRRRSNRGRALLIWTLVLGPFFMYGLAPLGACLLCVAGLFAWSLQKKWISSRHLSVLTLSLGLGTLLALPTLVFHSQAGFEHRAYLSAFHWPVSSLGLIEFIGLRFYEFSSVLLTPYFLLMVFLGVLAVVGNRFARWKAFSVIALLLVSSSAFLSLALVGKYPFGGIRQTIHLAPVLALTAGIALDHVLRCSLPKYRSLAGALILAIILISGAQQTIRLNPWRELHDFNTAFEVIEANRKMNEPLYVSAGAGYCVQMVQSEHRHAAYYEPSNGKPAQHLRDFLNRQEAPVVWLLFCRYSHFRQEHLDRLLAQALSESGYLVERTYSPESVSLIRLERAQIE